jgi:hypothetical protein
VTAINLCDLISNEIPQKCVPVSHVDKVISQIRQAQKSQTPSHGIRKRASFLKIIRKTPDGTAKIACFVAAQYAGFEQEIYLLKISAGENCSGSTFKYEAGSLRIANFLD